MNVKTLIQILSKYSQDATLTVTVSNDDDIHFGLVDNVVEESDNSIAIQAYLTESMTTQEYVQLVDEDEDELDEDCDDEYVESVCRS
jgi:hypothetical protein